MAPEASARGAREIGKPGRSVVPGKPSWQCAAHPSRVFVALASRRRFCLSAVGARYIVPGTIPWQCAAHPSRVFVAPRRLVGVFLLCGSAGLQPREIERRAQRVPFACTEVARDRTCRIVPRRRSGAARQPAPARPRLAPRNEFGLVHREALFADGKSPSSVIRCGLPLGTGSEPLVACTFSRVTASGPASLQPSRPQRRVTSLHIVSDVNYLGLLELAVKLRCAERPWFSGYYGRGRITTSYHVACLLP